MTPSRLSTRPMQRPYRWLVPAALLMALAAGSAQADVGEFITNLFRSGPLMTMEINTPKQRVSLRVNGSVTFTDAEDDVETVKGRVALQERRDFKTSRMVFEGDGKGAVQRTFTVDGKPAPIDAEARRWLATIIPAVLRETALDSDRRVRRLHAKGGPAAVIAEMERIESGYARACYVNGLTMLGPLNDESVRRTVQVIRGIDSDYERRTALVALLETQPPGAVLQQEVLAGVVAMQSDYEQRTVLVALAPRLLADPGLPGAWQAAMMRIESDFEARTVIEALARRDPLPAAQLDAAIQSTFGLNSDFEHAVALKALLRHLERGGPASLSAFLKSTQRINSEHERKTVLIALLEQAKLDKAGYAGVLQALSGMGSDHEIGAILGAVAARMPADAELVAAYRRVARRLGEHARGQAEKALDRFNL